MAENLQPESMSTWMRDVERRLAAVERPTRLSTVQYTTSVEPNTAVTTTSATFETVWEFALSQVVADAVSMQSIVVTAAGTSGEFRLRANPAGTALFTDVATVGAADEKRVRFDWLVPDLVIGSRGILIQLQARRTAGAGSVFVYNPTIAMQAPSFEINADSDGNPQVL